MTYVPVHCPGCQGVDVVRYGKQLHDAQRYRCNNTVCPWHIFLLQYRWETTYAKDRTQKHHLTCTDQTLGTNWSRVLLIGLTS
jgi:transposase-like protein